MANVVPDRFVCPRCAGDESGSDPGYLHRLLIPLLRNPRFRLLAALRWAPFALPVVLLPALAASLEDVVEEASRGVRESVISQQRVADLDDEAYALLERYRVVVRNIATLEAYVARLRQLIGDQESDMGRYRQELDHMEVFERELLPAMDGMLGVLRKSIDADLPFLPDERNARLLQLEESMRQSDVGAVEKFRRLMEVFRIESDYGRTIGAYRGRIDDGTDRVVNFLRVGRSLLAYQTLDGGDSGIWDAAAGRWRPLDDMHRADLGRALRIAGKQSAPDLLILPFVAPVTLEGLP